ncbi:MAG: hypothetical protein AAFN77_12530 [Planctomycetota bacterium]
MSKPRFFLFVFITSAFALTAISTEGVNAQQNSTRKLRVKPNDVASKIGANVSWAAGLDDAFKQSKKKGKPIFWYVPTLPNTFMDRKTEIDRYMLSGPFSWPAIVNTINEHAIPVRAQPTPDLQTKYKLNPYDFVEPGFLIISPAGEITYSIDRLTTIQPGWLLKLIENKLGVSTAANIYHAELREAWQAFAEGNYDNAVLLAEKSKEQSAAGDDLQVESMLLQGMSHFRLGKHDLAKSIWEQAGQQFKDHPLGRKAAAEAQMIGPFYRGFEVHGQLSEKAMLAGTASIGSAAPKGTYDENELWLKSTRFLLGMQHENGGFYDSDYDFGGTDSLPNVQVAVTSIAGMALLKAYDRAAEQDGLDRATIRSSIRRALSFVLDKKHINVVDRDEILWAYAFRLRFVARCKTHSALEFEADLDAALATCIDSLQSVQSRRGNWYHEYGNPFVTATALLALNEAKDAGGTLAEDVVEKGVASLKRDRYRNGAYPYGNSRQPKDGTEKDIVAAAGRMPLCELALLRFGASNDQALETAVGSSLKHHATLNSALKYDNHTSNLGYGGFFFWYDMRSRSEAIQGVVDQDQKKKFQQQHKSLIMELPELDGCFIDSHELGRVYGTSMALLSLDNVTQ